MGAGAGFFWWAGLAAGLQEGQALRCSSYLCLGLAVPTPMFLLTQPPYAMRALINNSRTVWNCMTKKLKVILILQINLTLKNSSYQVIP